MSGWTLRNYSIFRFILGSYLFVHFAMLVPWAGELFSSAGMMEASVSPLMGILPNPLGWFDAPEFATGFVVVAAVLSLALAGGFKDRIVAVVLWFMWACLLTRAPLITNPGIPFVGWLLLFHAAVPVKKDPEWRLPRSFYSLAWVLMAVGYTFSGVTKLGSPSWVDGTALYHVLESPLARPTFFREWLVSQPDLLRAMTYGVLGLEVLFAPLAAFRTFRPAIWLAMVLMHFGILVTVDFADLTMGMLLIHVITFDPAWLKAARTAFRPRGEEAPRPSTKAPGP